VLLTRFIVAIGVLMPSVALAGATVAVAPPSAPKKSGAEKIERAIRVKLVAVKADLHLVTERALAASAKRLEQEETSPQVAQDAGADLLIVVTVKKQGKKYSATGMLIDVASGNVLKSSHKVYGKGGAEEAGEEIGTELAKAAAEHAGPPAPVEQAKTRAVTPKDEQSSSHKTEPGDSKPAVIPKDEATKAGIAVTPQGAETNGESKVLQLTASIGTQMASAYTVTVGSQSTGLAYRLNPLFLVQGGARVMLPDLGLGLELGLSYAHVSYNIDVSPVVHADKCTEAMSMASPGSCGPSGAFFNFSALAFYQLTVTRFGANQENRFFVAPLAGVFYTSLSVDKQVPVTVVVGSSAFAPSLGGRFGVIVGAIEVEAVARANFVVSYSESPFTTGGSGGGFGLLVGAGGRFWVTENVGVGFNVGYDFMKIGLKGDGTRISFMGDPQLTNASVYSSDWKAALGAIVAL
jgi:hypothetical protein